MEIERRIGDTDNSSELVINQQDNGDIEIIVTNKRGSVASVIFCVPRREKGKSPETYKALVELYKAMKQENEADP